MQNATAEMVLVCGIARHIRQAGVPPGDSACSLALHLKSGIQDLVRQQSAVTKIAGARPDERCEVCGENSKST